VTAHALTGFHALCFRRPEWLGVSCPDLLNYTSAIQVVLALEEGGVLLPMGSALGFVYCKNL